MTIFLQKTIVIQIIFLSVDDFCDLHRIYEAVRHDLFDWSVLTGLCPVSQSQALQTPSQMGPALQLLKTEIQFSDKNKSTKDDIWIYVAQMVSRRLLML